MEYYSWPNPTQRSLEEAAGIPTGIAPDIQHQIERRRARRGQAPNNLVMNTPVSISGGQPQATA